jgi:FAD/FMN-containing dehydrogenase
MMQSGGLIACCAGVADVISAVNFARTHDLLVAVRAAGHNVAGISVCDGGLLIDLSRMKGMRVDLAARTIRVEAGLTWGEVNHELQVFGLAATGVRPHAGVSGLTLAAAWVAGSKAWPGAGQPAVSRRGPADGHYLTAGGKPNEDLPGHRRGGGILGS